jgi:hypothetical protein
MSDANDRIKQGIDRLTQGFHEYTAVVEEDRKILVGVIVYLMHKHRYETLTIPTGHLKDAMESRSIHIDATDDNQAKVTINPREITYDEIVNKGEVHLDWSQIERAHAVAIDPNVV